MVHPQIPLRVPCYDFAPLTGLGLGPKIGTSTTPGSLGVTGGEYKAQGRIHRGVADPRLLAIPASRGRVSALDPN